MSQSAVLSFALGCRWSRTGLPSGCWIYRCAIHGPKDTNSIAIRLLNFNVLYTKSHTVWYASLAMNSTVFHAALLHPTPLQLRGISETTFSGIASSCCRWSTYTYMCIRSSHTTHLKHDSPVAMLTFLSRE